MPARVSSTTSTPTAAAAAGGGYGGGGGGGGYGAWRAGALGSSDGVLPAWPSSSSSPPPPPPPGGEAVSGAEGRRDGDGSGDGGRMRSRSSPKPGAGASAGAGAGPGLVEKEECRAHRHAPELARPAGPGLTVDVTSVPAFEAALQIVEFVKGLEAEREAELYKDGGGGAARPGD
ncbi:hypothetical protein VTG60DRAFT_1243 [Thermothelomyces hinnuleus]